MGQKSKYTIRITNLNIHNIIYVYIYKKNYVAFILNSIILINIVFSVSVNILAINSIYKYHKKYFFDHTIQK